MKKRNIFIIKETKNGVENCNCRHYSDRKKNKDKDRHLPDRKKERKTEKQNKNKGRHHSDR
jgi:hypothetical protein